MSGQPSPCQRRFCKRLVPPGYRIRSVLCKRMLPAVEIQFILTEIKPPNEKLAKSCLWWSGKACSQPFLRWWAYLQKNIPVFKTGKNNKRLLCYLIQDDKGRFFLELVWHVRHWMSVTVVVQGWNISVFLQEKMSLTLPINLSACRQTSLAFLPWEWRCSHRKVETIQNSTFKQRCQGRRR